MADPYLLLWLEGPLQAWGHDSRFGRRDSLEFPTKSAVLGMLCCARGAGGAEVDWLRKWHDLDMQVMAYALADGRGGARPREPLLEDFQMVGSGYDDKDPWQTLLIPKTSEGKKAVGGGTKMTYRYYLQDMAFGVVLQAPKSEATDVVAALRSPVWDLYLGRKNCVPTEFIFQGLFDSVEEAEARSNQMAAEKRRVLSMRVVQGEHEGDLLTLNDVPVQFGTEKAYKDRRITIQKLE